jgi:hypothetical protein
MKMLHVFSRTSLLLAIPAMMLGACSSSSPSNTGTGGGGGTGTGTGGTGGVVPMDLIISDFEDGLGVVAMNGTPQQRNGYWYSYNDVTVTDATHPTPSACVQMPAPMAAYTADMVPDAGGVRPNSTSAMALHTTFSNCTTWGAGIGADFAQPIAADGGTYTGPKVPYNVGAYAGVSFWVRAGATPTDAKLRVKFPMTADTKIADGGKCDPAAASTQCSDDFGENIVIPTNGTWKQFSIKFTDATFKQEGWGRIFPWDGTDVTSIQVQSQGTETGQSYDFWVDDFVFIPK